MLGSSLPTGPFVLLDDARARTGRLYADPVEIVVARTQAEIAPALERLRAATRDGLHAAGWLDYEAGNALEPRLSALSHAPDPSAPPLLWFGLFAGFRALGEGEVERLLPDPAGARAATPVPRISREAYGAAVARSLDYIAAGDIYQVNLTFRADVAVAGDPRALYAGLRRAHASWGGLVHTGDHWLISASPELFFTMTDGAIVARPMKGTAPHGSDPARLAANPKDRAENLMIVDLIRNDLSRIAQAGSVAVPALFEIEDYPTVYQMTSTVTAALDPRHDAIDVLRAIFPCGSVTGAPKIRAQEIIAELEPDPRGPYTGSIGWLAPGGDAGFNVAIRTLVLEQGAAVASLGLGSAIVADSIAEPEWRECRDKGAFVTAASRPIDLIETMRFDPVDGIADLERHLARMKASADALGFAFDRHEARNELQAATFRLTEASRVRLLLSPAGTLAIEIRALPPEKARFDVAIMPLPVTSADYRLRHKTTDRAFYDAARRASGCDEVLFVDADGFLTEGSFTSLFVGGDGGMVTPPLSRGLLPGTLRGRLIDEGRAVEGDVRVEDLAGGFRIGNAVRGLIDARLVDRRSASAL